VLPVSKAVIAVIALFYAVSYWNSWFNILPLMPADSQKWPLQMAMSNYVQMAVVVLTVVPILIACPFVQKHFTKGVLLGAVKS
jgi:multiple sugar transport system permease protein/putative aldouronate transport system permease protein